MPNTIFISYRRRGESTGYAGRLADRLKRAFGEDEYFRDLEDIKPGTDFGDVIDEHLACCKVLLVVIGKDWLTLADASGRSRLSDPRDWVRLEVEGALKRDALVLPVLVGGATMPGEDQLPEPLRILSRRQAIELSETRWDYDVEQLLYRVAETVGLEPRISVPTRPPTVERKIAERPHPTRWRAMGWWGIAAAVIGGLGLWYGMRQGFIGGSVVWAQNSLVEPVEILRNGSPVDTVGPDARARLRISARSSTELRWRLLRPGNPPLGEAMEGVMPVLERGLGRRVWHVGAGAAGQRFFAPLISNTTPSDITVEINPGTAVAVRCNCVVPRGAVRAHVGYYRLYANSTVAAYNAAHPYTGPHSDQGDFAARVAPNSGAIVLTY